MKYLTGLSSYQGSRRTAITFGKFDGIHKGHQKLVGEVQFLGRVTDIDSIICAFDMAPFWKSRQMEKPTIMTPGERRSFLKGKADYLLECPFTQEFSSILPEEFIRRSIRDLFHARYVVVGEDFRFGCGKKGDIAMLKAFEKECGYELHAIAKERFGDREISSTYIKECIREGRADLAREMLGYGYGMTGTVISGNRLGRSIGFPTLNLEWQKEKVLPRKGVYFGRTKIDGVWYQSISNLGTKPTVEAGDRLLLESHLLGFQGDVYGKCVTTELFSFHREEKKFANIEALKEQILSDVEEAVRFFEEEREEKE